VARDAGAAGVGATVGLRPRPDARGVHWRSLALPATGRNTPTRRRVLNKRLEGRFLDERGLSWHRIRYSRWAERAFRQREGDNGLQRRRSARTCTSATRPAGPGGVERWAKNRGAVGPSANAFAPDIVVRLDSARAALSRLGHVGGATLTRPSFGAGRGCRPCASTAPAGALYAPGQ
jgi:hypothetical protein